MIKRKSFLFVNRKKEPYTVIPILVGSISASREAEYGEILAPYLADPQNFFIVSSDFCHWGSRFNYTYKGTADEEHIPIWRRIETLDKEGMAVIERIDPKAFTAYLKKTKNTICGRHPIGVLVNAVAKLIGGKSDSNNENGKKRKSDELEAKGNSKAEMKFVHYAQSSKVVSDGDSSVSYASAYLYLDL